MMSEQTTAIVPIGDRGVAPRSIDELYRLARAVAISGIAPKDMNTPEKCLVAMQAGMELGLRPFQALQGIHVINGRPGLSGKLALGLARSSGKVKSFESGHAGDKDDRHAWVKSERVDTPGRHETRFSVADARRAGLWGKAGPWTNYADRMLYWRAVGFHLADYYSDVLCGMAIAEELHDYPVTEAKPLPEPPQEPDPLLIESDEQADDVIEGEAVGADLEAENARIIAEETAQAEAEQESLFG